MAFNPCHAVRGERIEQGFNCYNGVVYWAFQSGAISLRLLWNEWLTKGRGNAPDEAKLLVQNVTIVNQYEIDTNAPAMRIFCR
jgi:hypothetical protein